MKNPAESRVRWLAQAEHQLDVAKGLLYLEFWADACFNAEQTGQMALKAFLFGVGRRYVHIHSIEALLEECGKFEESFLELLGQGRALDRFYLQTRYPDVLAAPAVPFKSFGEEDAVRAYKDASDIVDMVKSKPGEP